jgi:hypothetical protein
VYFVRYDGRTGNASMPRLIDNEPIGHQTFADISADGGVLHALWWDSRSDPCYSPMRPIGNCAGGATVASLDVWATSSTNFGDSWAAPIRVSSVTSNPNYEQFDNRAVPFAGDYLWITSMGTFAFGAWTDWRNTVAGSDAREVSADDHDAADVLQCRTQTASGDFTADTCPRDGGLDQDIYGTLLP